MASIFRQIGLKNIPTRNFIVLAAAATLLSSCNGGNVPTETSQKAEQKTPDLTFFQVKGPVKKITQFGYTIEFNKEGNLTSINSINPFELEDAQRTLNDDGSFTDIAKMERNDKGQIIKETAISFANTYTWENNLVVKVEGADEGELYTTLYSYNEEGDLICLSTQSVGGSDNCLFSGFKKDKHGNWTSRISKTPFSTDTVSRKIEYFD